ncbi:non-ribosomal peptide synthetase [Thiocapsa marina]|uniref:Amino acid adenylation domain protein n=1 Tax=Thiocapsa marina 5811 TaxID=768671 RepID=F9UAS5_9GAMM|nr:non-ribosomal peptide synthetase [Thiocapsa marina]EGV18543.1 amino acid adenylation domain protein [Thiocapsa marina 5811]
MKATPIDYDPFADGMLTSTLPATEAQKEIWAAAQLGDDASCAFNESIHIHLHGDLQPDALALAIERLVVRHESMRTTFSPDGELLCIVDSFRPEIARLDLSTEPDPEAALRAYCVRQVETPFDLEHGPLYRFSILRMSERHQVLVVTAHHIVCDGWSSFVMTCELGLLYDDLCGRAIRPLEAAPAFSEYLSFLRTQDRAKSRDYWVQQFKESLPALDLPTDKPRPSFRTFRSGRVDHLFDSDLVAGLNEVAGRCRASLVVLLFSGWMAYLHRITGATDLVTGMPAAGQNASGIHGLVGHCVNLLPIRVAILPSMSFESLVALTREKVLDALEHQDFTFGSLLQSLPIPRDPSRIPLVPVQFNVDPAGIVTEGFSGIEVQVNNNPRSFENFELFLNLTKVQDGIRIECQFNSDLFEEEGIRDRLREFETLMAGVVAEPTETIERLPVVPSDWRTRLIDTWNATEADLDLSVHVHEMVESQCAHSPHATALIAPGTVYNYQALLDRVNRLASALQRLDVGRGSLVGIALERDADMVVAALAIWKAGGAYVPLDPDFPPDRLRFMIDDAEVRLVVSTSGLAPRLPLEGVSTLLLDAESETLSEMEPIAPPNTSRPDDLAYIIYTSGSTGQPKGVRVLHRNLANFLGAMAQRPGLQPQDILLAVTTLSFDISLLELFLPLTVGATTLVASREQTRDGAALCDLLETSGATMMQATPATWTLLIESGWRPSRPFTALCGGEALSGELAARLIERTDRLYNMYGPTETTVWSSVHQVRKVEPIASIGTPIANTRMFVLSDAMQLAPVGVAGELFIGGAGVSEGYHNREDLTRDRFVMSPFKDGERLYRTGDLVRWRRGGTLQYLGRLDAQVKIRGFRLELGEVEAAMLRCEGVAEAVAAVYEAGPGDSRLVGYYVARDGSEIPAARFREQLAVFLPEYMLPNQFTQLDAIPLTPNRKADRKALPAPAQAGAERIARVAPRTQAERALAAIWQDVLSIEEPGIADDFFELGGHSILAARVIARLRDELGIQLPLRRLFENSRLEALAAHISTLMKLAEHPVDVEGSEREELAF